MKRFIYRLGDLVMALINQRRLAVVFVTLLLVSALAHGINASNFPYWENDEGVYVSQAWSWQTSGNLSPYTYWYDHAPAGWILIGIWQQLTGGPFAFEGYAVVSGRVLMGILHVFSAALVFYISRRLTGRNLPGVLAVLVFSLSPLAVYFQRRVLLDNMATFWILTGLAMLVSKKQTLWKVLFSGVLFSIAVLTKEVAVFFGPVYLFAVWTNFAKHRVWGVVLWLTVAGLVVSSYPLYALLKTELFPVSGQVSLIGTLKEHLSRGADYPFWDSRSLFADNFRRWVERDAVLVYGAVVSMVLGVAAMVRFKELRIPVIAAWGMGIFLLRSKLVIDFYILPLIPFVAMIYGILTAKVIYALQSIKVLKSSAVILGVGVTAAVFFGNDIGLYRRNESEPIRKAVSYLKENADRYAHIVADSSIFLDLKLSRDGNEKPLVNTDWAWKVEKDEAVFKKLNSDWRNIDYVVLSHEILKQIRDFDAVTLRRAVDSADILNKWTEGSTSYIDFGKYLSTNGDWMAVLEVKDVNEIVLASSWNYYKQNFIHSYGQIIDPQSNSTTSEGQAYAMLRSVWMNDKKTFEGVWSWTKDHLQFRTSDKLFSWLWKDNKLADSATATDGDIDIALALIMASKRFENQQYLNEAKQVVADIWRKSVVSINGRYVLIAAENGKRQNGYLVNPSYFSPAFYRIFAEIDPTRPWLQLADDSYVILNVLADAKTGLVPNWVWVNEESGEILSAAKYVASDPDVYGYDAFRTYWRVALDALWFEELEAKLFLQKPAQFFRNEKESGVKSVYQTNGRPKVDFGSPATSVGALATFKILDVPAADRLMVADFNDSFSEEPTKFWGEPDNYYTQNWAWFGYALWSGKLVKF